MAPVKKVLVINRGEIAVRIIRACKEMGCETIAVYSEVDRMQPHVRMADRAYNIGPPEAKYSYLNLDRLLEVAEESGADSVHPGYGFLAENAEAAEAFIDAGLVWIGPSPSAIRQMGNKLTARSTALDAGLPLVPGMGNTDAFSEDVLHDKAEEMGYPVIVKAASGGGGKGMRVVYSSIDLMESLRIARLESESSFGDDRVYIEKFITDARHIEIQILGDQLGNIIHLGERDCSLQRRHQKLVEEAPCPIMDEQLRNRMGECAVKVAREVGYFSAGTVEFVFDSKTHEFYFLEMNTRLQVEHTITERVTGVDIVKEMIRIAREEPLTFKQEDIEIVGHSIECRILAENAETGFMPSIGRISGFNLPSGPGVRTDTGVTLGTNVSPYYDSLLAKIVIWDTTREEAIVRTKCALEEFHIAGIDTTIPFYIHLMGTEAFKTGNFHTRFLEKDYNYENSESDELKIPATIAATLLAHDRNKKAFILSSGSNGAGSRWKHKKCRRRRR